MLANVCYKRSHLSFDLSLWRYHLVSGYFSPLSNCHPWLHKRRTKASLRPRARFFEGPLIYKRSSFFRGSGGAGIPPPPPHPPPPGKCLDFVPSKPWENDVSANTRPNICWIKYYYIAMVTEVHCGISRAYLKMVLLFVWIYTEKYPND